MKILFNGGLFGREALCYQGREIVKRLSKTHTIEIDGPKTEGYWEKYYGNFKLDEEDVYLMNGHPHILPKIAKCHKKIIHITVFETIFPKEWVDALNIPEVKQIWTISEFNKKLLIDSGVKKDIQVIYLGIDEEFKKKDINLFPKDKTFKFFNICAPHCTGIKDRKGLHVLLPAFKEEFGDDPKVTLLLKINTIYADQNNRGTGFKLHDYLAKLLPEGVKMNNVAILQDYYKTDMINNLYNSIDCGVFPSMSEGFGYPQAELIKIGKPVITTDYSATNEFSDPKLRIKIDGMTKLDISNRDHPYYDKEFAEPNKEDLKHLMRCVYQNYEAEKRAVEEFSNSDMIKSFNWDKIADKLNELLKKI